MDDRKLLTADFNRLKERVKAEMLRRAYSGSVAAYGGSGYDFTPVPADNQPVLGEHLRKNLAAMQAVNGDGLPRYPGGLSKAEQVLMETKAAAWGTRSIEDHAASDCKSGCTGTCYNSCQTGCYTGCSGCSGCGSGCAGGCEGCGSGCAGGCEGCGSGCASSCSAYCASSCNDDCQSGCRESCTGTCSGGCGAQCSTGCSGGCSNTAC